MSNHIKDAFCVKCVIESDVLDYFLNAVGAVFFPSAVTGCSISSAQINAFYGTGDGFWRIQLAWSSGNPDCTVHLQEEVDGKMGFHIVDSKKCRL